MKKGDELTADISALSSEGKGIARLEDGFVVFVEKTLPGDTAKFKIKKKKSGYAEARLIEIISPSPFRLDPVCAYFGVCGGCKIQNYNYDQQVKFKTEAVKNAFERIGGFGNVEVPEAIKGEDIFFYRNKMEFSFSDDRWRDEVPVKVKLQNTAAIQDEDSAENPETLDNIKISQANTPLSSPLTGGIEGGPVFEEEWIRQRGLIRPRLILPYNPKLKERARELRKNCTHTERLIWDFVNSLDEKFYRQRPIDHFIADFYCPSAGLIIEIDGDHHSEEDYKIYDNERSSILTTAYGLEIIRFTNNKVINAFEKVCDEIKRKVEERKKRQKANTPLSPSLSGGIQDGHGNDNENESYNFALGLHVPRFHSKIVDIKKCYLQSELSARIVNFTRDFFKEKGSSIYTIKTHTGYLRFLIIRQSSNTKDLMINLVTNEYDKELIDKYSFGLQSEFPEVTTLVNSISTKKAQVAFGEQEHLIFGEGYITEKLKTDEGKEYTYKISPNSFFQTNSRQAEKLYNITAAFGEFSKNDNVLDLYCGAGSIAIFISGKVNKVLGVEIVEDAIKNANENKELNNIANADFILSDIKDFIESRSIDEYNKIILDPPRAGLHPDICEALAATRLERIVYVSCNPSTQARDISMICSKGNYKIEKIQPVDMFPHTYHVENVVSLVRA